ncbi:MAG: hypothetical protein ACYTGN_17960 [Planctomycetota bacterium]
MLLVLVLALLAAACGSTPKPPPTPTPTNEEPDPAPTESTESPESPEAPAADDPGAVDGPGAGPPTPAADPVETALGSLERLEIPGLPYAWAQAKAVLADASAAADANAGSEKLRRAHEEAVIRFRARADEAFRKFPHGMGRSFFAMYPVEVDAAGVVERCIDDVRSALSRRGPSGYEAFFKVYGKSGALGAETIDAVGADYGAAWLKERCGERAPTLAESIACLLAVSRFGIREPPEAARVTLLVVEPEQVEGAFDFDVDVSDDGLASRAARLADDAIGRLFIVRPVSARAELKGSKERAEAKRTVVLDYYLLDAGRARRGRFTAMSSRTFEPPDPKAISAWMKAAQTTPLRDVLTHATRNGASLQSLAADAARAEINR